MKDKYVDRKEEMGKLIEEEYEVEGKDIKEDTTGFSIGKKALKQATEKAIEKKDDKMLSYRSIDLISGRICQNLPLKFFSINR